MTTSQYTGLFQHRSGSISLTDGQFYSPRLNSNGELIVDGTLGFGSTIFEFDNADSAAVTLVDSNGDPITNLFTPRERKVHQMTTITASTSETTVLTAATSTYHDVYGVIVTNTSDTATEVAFKDDTGGLTRFTISAPANDTRGFMLPIDAAVPASSTNDTWTATVADSVSSILITVFAVKNS